MCVEACRSAPVKHAKSGLKPHFHIFHDFSTRDSNLSAVKMKISQEDSVSRKVQE